MITWALTSWHGKRIRHGAAALAFVAAWFAGPDDVVDGETGLASVLGVRAAHAEPMTIKNPGDHPSYVFEAEPHGLVGFAGPFRDEDEAHLGVGFRGTIVLLHNGFITTINNSIGISFGADFYGDNTLFLPVAMQWNFWLSQHWSVFGEPGLGLALKDFETKVHPVHPILMAGGRYHFSDKLSLTMRIGYPALSVGVSFFL